MALDPEFGRRARIALARMDHPPSLKEIAETVRKATGRPTLTPQAVGGWFKGQEPESFKLTEAFAAVLHVEPSWLAFGKESPSATTHSEVSNAGPPMYYGEEIKPAEKPAAKTGTTHRKR